MANPRNVKRPFDDSQKRQVRLGKYPADLLSQKRYGSRLGPFHEVPRCLRGSESWTDLIALRLLSTRTLFGRLLLARNSLKSFHLALRLRCDTSDLTSTGMLDDSIPLGTRYSALGILRLEIAFVQRNPLKSSKIDKTPIINAMTRPVTLH